MQTKNRQHRIRATVALVTMALVPLLSVAVPAYAHPLVDGYGTSGSSAPVTTTTSPTCGVNMILSPSGSGCIVATKNLGLNQASTASGVTIVSLNSNAMWQDQPVDLNAVIKVVPQSVQTAGTTAIQAWITANIGNRKSVV